MSTNSWAFDTISVEGLRVGRRRLYEQRQYFFYSCLSKNEEESGCRNNARLFSLSRDALYGVPVDFVSRRAHARECYMLDVYLCHARVWFVLFALLFFSASRNSKRPRFPFCFACDLVLSNRFVALYFFLHFFSCNVMHFDDVCVMYLRMSERDFLNEVHIYLY